MLLVGPWRDRGIAQQPVEFQFRDVVAFAGALLQRFLIEDGHVAAPIAHQSGSLQSAHHIGDGGSCRVCSVPSKRVTGSRGGIAQRWDAGYVHTKAVLARSPWVGEFDPLSGVILHEQTEILPKAAE